MLCPLLFCERLFSSPHFCKKRKFMSAEIKPDFVFSWSDELSVDIKEVDEQHSRVVGFVNELQRAIKHQQGRAVSLDIIARLTEYTRTHFLFEENLMHVTNYPDSNKHRQQHQGLLNSVAALQKKLVEEDVPITEEHLYFLKNWLSHHICESDRTFGDYFQAMNVKKIARENEPPTPKKPWWKF